jgi:hypothetical protein
MMAKRAEKEPTATEESKMISQAAFDRLLKKVKSAETEMSESKGRMGSAVDQAITDHNLHKEAFRIIRKYLKKSPESQSEFIMHLDHLWDLAGLAESRDDIFRQAEETKPETGGGSVTHLRAAADKAS